MPSRRRWNRCGRRRPRPPPSSTTHISKLCPDILEQIFGYLPEVADKGRAAQVCKAWRDASYLPSVWRNVEAKLRLERTQPWDSLSLRRVRRVRVLSVNANGVKEVARRLPLTVALSLRWCSEIEDCCLSMVANNFPELQSLDLTGCRSISDTALMSIAKHLRKLKVLDLSLCSGITDLGIKHLACFGLELQTLVLTCCCDRLTNKSLYYISCGLRKLENLDLSGCHQVTDAGLRYVARMTGLRRLDLSNRLNLSSHALSYLAMGGSRVTSLRLNNCVRVKNDGLYFLARMTTLSELSLRSCYIGDSGLFHLLQVGSRIVSLDLGFCDKVTDGGLLHLAKLTSLRGLDLTGCCGISEIGLGHLADSDSRVTSLCVRDCCRLGSETLTRLARGLFSLRHLMLDVSHLSDEGKVLAANNLIDLNTFYVMGTNLFNDLRKLRNHPDVIRLATSLPVWSSQKIDKSCPNNTHVSVLPPQVLVLIFCHLNLRDKGRVARVCLAWRDAAYHPSVWSWMDVRLYLTMQSRLRETNFPWTSIANRGVRRVQAYRFNTWGLCNMTGSLPKLQSLDLLVARHEQLMPRLFVRKLQHLTRLRLNICDNIHDDCLKIIAQQATNLKCLEMTVCTKLTDAALLHVATGLKKLQRLALAQCRLVTDAGVGHLTSGGQNLISLVLRDCQKITDKSLQYLSAGVPGLESLDLSGCHNVTNSNGALSGLTKLRRLYLSGCRGFGDLGLVRLTDSAVVVLNLEACASLTDEGMRCLAKMTDLRQLDLSFSDRITDVGLQHLMSPGGSLITDFNLRCCDTLSENALFLLAKGMTELRTITLDERHINEKGRTLAACNLLLLKAFRVSGFNHIHDLKRLRLRQMMDDILSTL